ncbi:MAG: hypothetical protein V1836_03065 [Candidatus Aenigmatarchaeota archaeon]
MIKTRKKLAEYWDGLISKRIPPFATFGKIEDEIKEHLGFLNWTAKRIVLPLAVFYLLMSFVLQTRILGSLFLSLLVFLYSNFLPDVGYLVKKTKKKRDDWGWQEKYSLLFFAPVVLYYVIAGRAKPLYSVEDKPFHNAKTVLVYGLFLLALGYVLWGELIKAAMLATFGMLGFCVHLLVDRKFRIS